MTDARRVLVVQTAFLGDVVLTTPLFRALKRVLPGCRLSALVTPEAAPLVEEDPHLDELLTYDKKGGEGFGAVLAKIRRGTHDLLVAPHRSHRTGLLALLSGVPERVGFRQAGFSWAYNRKVERPSSLHEVDRNLALVRGLGAEPLDSDRVLHVGYGAAEARAVEELLTAAAVGSDERLIGLCPGSVWATKRWSAEGYARVGRELSAQGFRVVLLGGPGDRAVCAEVARGIGPACVDAAGRTPLKALAAWMDRLALVVTNDSGPLHVAAARGTPTVAIFGATTPALGFGPFHSASRVVEADLPCRPCGKHGPQKCPEGHFRCMGQVSPESVLRAAGEILGEAA